VNLYINAIVKIIKDSYPKFTIGRIETISASSSVQEAAKKMKDKDISSLVVIER
jgi:CBS domain-containing protein